MVGAYPGQGGRIPEPVGGGETESVVGEGASFFVPVMMWGGDSETIGLPRARLMGGDALTPNRPKWCDRHQPDSRNLLLSRERSESPEKTKGVFPGTPQKIDSASNNRTRKSNAELSRRGDETKTSPAESEAGESAAKVRNSNPIKGACPTILLQWCSTHPYESNRRSQHG